MTYNLKNLNVSSLDFDDIVSSLSKFLNEQPDLTDIDFKSPGSAASMLVNILATATAYNGVYGQMSFTNSWPCSATMTETVLSSASLASIVIPYTRSAKAGTTISVGGTAGIDAYTTFDAINRDGSSTFFYNVEPITSGEGVRTTLYSGKSVVTYTNYDYISQSIFIPNTVDPNTINFYVATTSGSTASTRWTKVDKGSMTSTADNTIFTVMNATNGYLVTNNLPNAQTLDTNYRPYVKAIESNGSVSNGANISNNSLATLTYTEIPYGGYAKLNLAQAKAMLNFNSNGQQRCVTLSDFKNAIACSGLPQTSDTTNITVANHSVPSTVKVYVNGMGTSDQELLLNYLSSKTIAGISVVYSL